MKLPLKPKILFIVVFSVKIKLGSSGEQEINEINNKIEKTDIKAPKTSISLLIMKFEICFAILLISIILNQINNFVSFNNCC